MQDFCLPRHRIYKVQEQTMLGKDISGDTFLQLRNRGSQKRHAEPSQPLSTSAKCKRVYRCLGQRWAFGSELPTFVKQSPSRTRRRKPSSPPPRAPCPEHMHPGETGTRSAEQCRLCVTHHGELPQRGRSDISSTQEVVRESHAIASAERVGDSKAVSSK